MKKKVLALLCAGTLICGSAFQVSAESVTAADIAQRVESINAGLEAGAKMEFKDDKITVTVAGGPQQGVELKLDGNSLAIAAAAVNTAAEKVESQKKADLEAAIGKKLLDDVTVSAINLSDSESITAVTKIASKLAKEIKERVKGDDSIIGVRTAVVEISRTSGSKDGGYVALNIANLGLDVNVIKMIIGEQEVFVLHYDGSEVKTHPCKITETGTLYFEMTSFSPVCIVVTDISLHETGEENEGQNQYQWQNQNQGQGNASQQTPNKTPVSPKTADAEAAVVIFIAMMGIAGIAVCQKKIRS